MGEIASILALLRGVAPEITVGLVGITVFVTLYLNARRVNLDAITSVSDMQARGMTALIQQNQQLAEDLHRLRAQQAELHGEIDTLRAENARMYRQIAHLETLVSHYIAQCGSCQAPKAEQPRAEIPFKAKGRTQ